MIEQLMTKLQETIAHYGLNLLNTYPDDLLVHDRATFDKYAKEGATIAWVVGHCHTHLVPLGLHPKANEEVTYLTNLANDDRFFVLQFAQASFTMKEVSRNTFSALVHTTVPYHRNGSKADFSLFKRSARVGHVNIEFIGDFQNNRYHATITPASGTTDLDRAALQVWAQRSVVEAAGTLFSSTVLEWKDPVVLPQSRVAA